MKQKDHKSCLERLEIDMSNVGMFLRDRRLDSIDLVAKSIDDLLAVLLHEFFQLLLRLDRSHLLMNHFHISE